MAAARDNQGRFVKGHSGNPAGRRPKAKELSYLAIVTDVVTPEEFRLAVQKALAMAKRGDLAAMRFLTEYILGKPTQDISLEAFDGEKIVLTWDDSDIGNSVAEAP